jgi:magnesium transporter
MHVEAYVVTQDRLLETVDAQTMSDEWFCDDTIRWIRVTSATPDEVERALRPLELHPRIVQACANPRPSQVDALEKVQLIAVPLWTPGVMASSSLRFVCMASTLITIQDAPFRFLDERVDRLRGDLRLVEGGTAALTLDLVRVVRGALFTPYLELRADVEATAEVLERKPNEVGTDDLLGLKRRATKLANLLEDYLHCVLGLQEARSETIGFATVRPEYQDLVGDAQRGQELLARIQDRIRDLRQSSLNYVQESTNRRLNILAVLSAIYLPPTLIAGLYGMNFENIPITQALYGYFVVLSLMIGLVVGQACFFYRRGYFK